MRWIVVGGVFAVLAVPFFVSNGMFFPFITGKGFLFRGIVEVIFFAWLVLAYADPAYRPKKSLMLYAVLGFAVVVAMADFMSENMMKSIWSNYERMEGLVTILHLAVYTIVAATVLNTEKLWMRFFQASVFASALMAFYGLFQLWGIFDVHQGSTRLDATLGNSAYLAVYMLWNIFFAVFLAVRERGWNLLRYAYTIIAILDVMILYHTATRGTIIGLIGGAFLTAVLVALFGEKKSAVRRYSAGVIIALVVVVGGFFAAKDTQFVRQSPVLERFASISLQDNTTKSRFMIWNMAWQGFKERPVLGWGQESFNFVFNKYYNPEMYAQESWFDRAHNVFLDWLIAGGILGLGGYLTLFGVAIYLMWCSKSHLSVVERSIFTGLLGGYFIHNFFVFDNLISYILFFSFLAYLAMSTKREEHSQTSLRKSVSPDGHVIVLAAVGALLVMYMVNYRPYMANLALIHSIDPGYGLTENLKAFQRVIAYDSFGTPEAREQLMLNVSRVVASPQAPDDLKKQFVDFAKEQMDIQAAEAPRDARYQLFAGNFWRNMGDYQKALGYLQNARELSPKKQAILMEIGSVYLNSGEYDKALEVLKEAYDLAPTYDDARIAYAVGAIYKGDNKLAEEILAPLNEQYGGAIPSELLLQAYVKRNDYQNALKIAEALVAQDPGDVSRHVSLAALYLQVGERVKAVEELKRAIELNPQFKDQGEYYIKEIQAGRNP